MSLFEGRGGWPHVFLGTILHTAVRHHRFGFVAKYLKIRATTNECKVYFTEADATGDVNYITVPVAAAATPHGEWEGPCEVREVWLKGLVGSSAVELVAFQRRG